MVLIKLVCSTSYTNKNTAHPSVNPTPHEQLAYSHYLVCWTVCLIKLDRSAYFEQSEVKAAVHIITVQQWAAEQLWQEKMEDEVARQ